MAKGFHISFKQNNATTIIFAGLQMSWFSTTVVFLFCLSSASAQPEFSIDSTVFHTGIVKMGSYEREIPFINTGNTPLVIQSVKVSRGNCMMSYPKEPIMPGATAKLKFHMKANYVSTFTTSVTVQWNNPGRSATQLRFKGRVVRHRTTMALSKDSFQLKKLDFFEMDTLRFSVKNTGDYELYIGEVWHPECDLLYTARTFGGEKNGNVRTTCAPNDSVFIEMVFVNVLGDLGPFNQEIGFVYNNKDSFKIQVMFHYVGEPQQTVLAFGNDRLVYEDDQIVRRDRFWGGTRREQHWYEEGRLRKTAYYYNEQPQRVRRYWKGRVVSR